MLKSGMQINTNKFSFSEIVSLCYSKCLDNSQHTLNNKNVCYSEVGPPVGLYYLEKSNLH